MHRVATLLERERDLAELRSVLTDTREGRGRLVLAEGAAGLGKTSLLRAALELAADADILCLRARASELERDFAYGCVRQLLEPVVARAAEFERARLFDGAAALAQPLLAAGGGVALRSTADNTFSMLHGLYWLLNNLAAGTPTILCIDDLHWADGESLRFLNYLTPRLDGLAVAVVASVRSEHTTTEDLARLVGAPETTVLRLQPLSIAATATLCEQRLGAPVAHDFAAACRDATGGNPFYLEALLREAEERRLSMTADDAERVRRLGPAAVAQAVLVRLSGAPSAATGLVRAAAVLGDGASVAEIAHLAELPRDEAARAADLLGTLGILKGAETVEFAHPIIREAVYTAISSRDRMRLHARAAEILAADGVSEERIAAQLAASEPSGDPTRVALLRRVAAAALARGAPAAAVAWLRRALAEPPPPTDLAEVMLELGAAELRLALPVSVEHLAAAVAAIRQPSLLANAVRELANAFSLSGHAERAARAIESAIPTVEAEDPELALLLEAEFAAKALQAGLEVRAAAAQRLERYRGLPGVTAGQRLVLASVAFQRARASESSLDAVAHIERALAGGSLLREQDLDVVGPFYALLIALLDTDALDLADRCLEQALADARGRASIPALAFLIAHRGWFALRRGSVAQAETDARTALEMLTAHRIQLGHRFALALLVEALLESGDVDGAERTLATSGLAVEIPPGLASNHLLQARARLRLQQSRTHAGLEDLLEFGRRDELWGAANPLASRWRSLACVPLAATGDRAGALRLAAEDVERARRWGAAAGVGMALRAHGLVEGGRAGIAHLHEGAQVLQRSLARLEHARTLVDLGAALRRANRRAEARDVLKGGLTLASQCDAAALVERAHIELRAAGGRSSDAGGGGIARLTVAERRVAEMAAQGHSNPQIAQALFVTRKTVETHLGHIYGKLGISGRVELTRVLADKAANVAR
jgi:DNA-binding CsgD family transcriptional regulator